MYNTEHMGFKFSNKINTEAFISNYTPNSVYILGLLWADGTVNKKTNSFSIECVKNDIDYFYPIFQTTGEYGLYVRNRIGRKTQGTIVGTSLELSTYLKSNDYTKKSLLSPYKILSHIPNELKKYFFLGWSDGDGCFYFNENNTFQYCMSGSYEQNWGCLIDLCEKLNIQYKIDRRKTKRGNQYSSFRICRKYDIVILGNYLYNNTELGLERKKNIFNQIKEKSINKLSTHIECFKNDILIKEFQSLSSASKWINKNRNVSGDINDACVGRQKTAFGYKWKKSYIN